MDQIIRTPTRASGGITPEEKVKMDAIAQKWIKRAFRTDPIEPDKIVLAIKALYAAAGLECKRVVIVPSPLVMVFAYGAAAWIWHERKTGKGSHSVRKAVSEGTQRATSETAHATLAPGIARHVDVATYSLTRDATQAATNEASWSAMDAPNDALGNIGPNSDATIKAAADACLELAGKNGIECAKRWRNAYQGGNMWAAWPSYAEAMRDVIGLTGLDCWKKYQSWEDCAIHGGFRVMHEEFCMVSDFPSELHVDARNLSHCETGPSHRWRDGFSIYHWHGVRVPSHWIEDRAHLDPREVIAVENVEQRAAGCAIVGWPKMLSVLNARVIHDSGNPLIGQLIELDLPGLSEPGRFLKAECPRNGTIVEGVPRVSEIDNLPIDTAIAAQAWRIGDPQSEFIAPPRRT